MSRENVKKFYELAEKDVDLVQKLASLDSEMSLEASDLANLKDIVNEKIIPLAKEKGLDFTAEEMVDFANEKYMKLDATDLLEVSGGVSPKAAGLALSSVLMLSLGSAAAINLMNSNHDNISNVVSDVAPSKMASGEKEEGDNEEEKLQKDLDEMLKKLPKDKSKDSNMEDIEKELDKLFKGGKFGGGSAFRPGKGRAASKNMLNRTIGKKGTSDFDFEKFLKELDDEIARESATSQAAKPKTANSEGSDFDFDKFIKELNSGAEVSPQVAQKEAASSGIEEKKRIPAPTSTEKAKSVNMKEEQTPVKDEIKEETKKDTSASGLEDTSSEDLQKAAEDLAKEHVEDVLKQIIAENDKFGDEKLDIDGVISTLKDALEQDDALKGEMKIENDVVTISVKGAVAGQQEEATVTKTIDLHESYNELVTAQERIALDKKDAEEVVQDIKETSVEKPLTQGSDVVFENQNQIQKIVNDLASAFKLTVENAFKFNDVKTQLSEKELQQFVSGITDAMKSNQDMKKVAIVGSNTFTFFAKGQLKDGTAVEASKTVNVLELAKELNAKFPEAELEEKKEDETAKPQEALKENPVVKADAGATVTTSKKLQEQADMKIGLVKTELYKKFQEKIKANNGIELNEANLNKLISETLNSYKGQENVTVDEKNGTFTFTAKGVTKGLILTGADSRSATLNVREFFAKLNNEAKTAHDAAMKQKIEEKKNAVEKEIAAKKFGVLLNKDFVPITEAELQQAHDFYTKELKQSLKQGLKAALEAKIRDIYSAQCKVARINFDSSKGVPTAVAAKIVNDLTEEQKKEFINSVMKNRLTTFQKPGEIKAHEQHGVLSWEPAALNEEVKVKVTADVKSFLLDPSSTSKETIVNVRNELDSLKESYKLKYTDVVGGTIVGKNADKEVEALFNFLTDNKLVENGIVVHSVLDRIKDSDKEQFKKDVQHVAKNISGGEGSYSLSGKWRTYNVSQEKLNAIKNLATQLGG